MAKKNDLPVYIDTSTPNGKKKTGPLDYTITSLLRRLIEHGVGTGMVDDRRPSDMPAFNLFPDALFNNARGITAGAQGQPALNPQNQNTRFQGKVSNIQAAPPRKPVQFSQIPGVLLQGTRSDVPIQGPLEMGIAKSANVRIK